MCVCHVYLINYLLTYDDLHWLDLPRRVLFKICVMVYKSLQGIWRLVELCRLSPTFRGAVTSALQRVDFCIHLAITYQRTENEPFLMAVHLPGILFQDICGHLICL